MSPMKTKTDTVYYQQPDLFSWTHQHQQLTGYVSIFCWAVYFKHQNFAILRILTYNSSLKVQRFTVPQKFFLHFYVVGAVVTTSLLLAIWFYAYMKMTPLMPEPSSYSTIASHLVGGSNSFSLANFWSSRPMEHKHRVWRTVFVLILMEIQVLRRLYETEHVFHYSPSARMHIIGYLTGIL
jgi:3-oxo-5-alpha-steroid 4-dehydrogenase 3